MRRPRGSNWARNADGHRRGPIGGGQRTAGSIHRGHRPVRPQARSSCGRFGKGGAEGRRGGHPSRSRARADRRRPERAAAAAAATPAVPPSGSGTFGTRDARRVHHDQDHWLQRRRSGSAARPPRAGPRGTGDPSDGIEGVETMADPRAEARIAAHAGQRDRPGHRAVRGDGGQRTFPGRRTGRWVRDLGADVAVRTLIYSGSSGRLPGREDRIGDGDLPRSWRARQGGRCRRLRHPRPGRPQRARPVRRFPWKRRRSVRISRASTVRAESAIITASALVELGRPAGGCGAGTAPGVRGSSSTSNGFAEPRRIRRATRRCASSRDTDANAWMTRQQTLVRGVALDLAAQVDAVRAGHVDVEHQRIRKLMPRGDAQTSRRSPGSRCIRRTPGSAPAPCGPWGRRRRPER